MENYPPIAYPKDIYPLDNIKQDHHKYIINESLSPHYYIYFIPQFKK